MTKVVIIVLVYALAMIYVICFFFFYASELVLCMKLVNSSHVISRIPMWFRYRGTGKHVDDSSQGEPSEFRALVVTERSQCYDLFNSAETAAPVQTRNDIKHFSEKTDNLIQPRYVHITWLYVSLLLNTCFFVFAV